MTTTDVILTQSLRHEAKQLRTHCEQFPNDSVQHGLYGDLADMIDLSAQRIDALSMKNELDTHHLDTLAWAAFQYVRGRQTYMVESVVRALQSVWDKIPPESRGRIMRMARDDFAKDRVNHVDQTVWLELVNGDVMQATRADAAEGGKQ